MRTTVVSKGDLVERAKRLSREKTLSGLHLELEDYVTV